MTNHQSQITNIQLLLNSDQELQQWMQQSLALASQANPHRETNPVRTIDDWCAYVSRFAQSMPWQTMDIGEDASFFRRIDQNIGYFYFLLDQPLDALRDKGYIYPSLQYEPRIAEWLVDYNKAWGEYLSSPDSWNDSYYNLARADARFELNTDRYESPSNWHSWNDFFARKLKQSPITYNQSPIVSPSDGVIMDYPVKTVSTTHLQDLLGDSPYASRFKEGKAIHLVLDVFDYHRFHAPCEGRVVEHKIIPGIHAGGGVIIWDEEQGRYRYDQLGATGFQSLETRGVLVLDTPDFGHVALIAVGIQQVSSICWSIIHHTPYTIHQGDELGCFKFGGSDIILLFEPGKAPAFQLGKSVKVGELMV